MKRFLIGLFLMCVIAWAADLPILRHYGTTNDWPIVAGTLTNGLMPKAGGTFTGAAYSTAASASNAPAENELPTAGWVLGLFGSGATFYATTNIDSGATNVGSVQYVYKFESVSPEHAKLTFGSLTNNQYVSSVITTNSYLSLSGGGVLVNTYLGISGGGSMTVKPEIYYSYNKSDWYGDWPAEAKNITTGTNLYQWVISVPETVSTNSTGFYLQRRFKVVSVIAAPTLHFCVGTNTDSHIHVEAASASLGNAYLGYNQTFTGTNVFTQPPIFATGAQWTNTVRWDSDYGFQNGEAAWCYTLTNPVWSGEFRVPDTYRSIVITNSLVTATSLIIPFVCEMAEGLTWLRQPGIGARATGYFTLDMGAVADGNPNWMGFLLLKP